MFLHERISHVLNCISHFLSVYFENGLAYVRAWCNLPSTTNSYCSGRPHKHTAEPCKTHKLYALPLKPVKLDK